LEWQFTFLIIFGGLAVLMASGLPIAFAFLLFNVVGVFLLWGGQTGLHQLALSIGGSIANFTLLPVPLFILMGEVMYQSGIAPRMMDALDKWLGRLPGRLGLMAVGGGTILSTLTGVSMASVAILGSVLVPEMEKRGYKKPMSLGPILGSGGLAIMIPPSAIAVLLGAIGRISVGKILIGIIVPGLLMAICYAAYIIIRCRLQPSLAPTYEPAPSSLWDKLITTIRYILPLSCIVFLVTGVIILGIATPSEAAATGALGTFILAVAYGRLSWTVLKKSVMGTVSITTMILMLVTGARAFSQILAYSGASQGMIEFVTGLPAAPIFILFGMLLVIMLLGMFVNLTAIMMITLPLFMPIVNALDFNPVWFAIIMMLSLEMATTTPPFGMVLFTMKGVAPPGTTMRDIYKAALPFLGCDLIVLILLIAFPAVTLWLPALMARG